MEKEVLIQLSKAVQAVANVSIDAVPLHLQNELGSIYQQLDELYDKVAREYEHTSSNEV